MIARPGVSSSELARLECSLEGRPIMTKRRISATCVVVCLLGSASLRAQSGAASDANSGASASVVPRLIKFGGAINPQIGQIAQIKENESGKNQLSTVVGVTFSLYELQEG